jgi:predicted RNA-binding protein with PUA-like domain
MNWLVKEEPSHYAFDALLAEGQTTWTGVRNAVAQKHLRAIKKGDRIFYYHTGEEKAVVGTARALGDAYPDPDDSTGRSYVVDIAPVGRVRTPVTLKTIKADPYFADFALTRVPRLSVMPVTDEQWSRIEALGKTSS